MSLSFEKSKERFKAIVNSTTPRLADKCPPLSDVTRMSSSLISLAKTSSSGYERSFKNSGFFISFKSICLTLLIEFLDIIL